MYVNAAQVVAKDVDKTWTNFAKFVPVIKTSLNMAAIFCIIRTFEMTKNLDEFFIPDNEVRLPDELDYSRVDEYIRSAEAFRARLIRASISSTISGRTSCMYRPIRCFCADCRRNR